MVLNTAFDCLPSWVGHLAFGTTLFSLILWLSSCFNAYRKHEGSGGCNTTVTENAEKQQLLLDSNEVFVFSGKTSHTRLLPRVHSFWYHFLITAVPVRSCNSNWFVSVDSATKPWWRRGWLRVDPPDHLQRGEDENGLSHKLDRFLCSRQYNPAEYPTVWLVTSPRFLGYKSDQASFWYLYTADGRLDMMIIEANNSFDERKVWVVPAAQDNGTFPKTQRRKFHQDWPKEFHVSPFNSTHGFYSISTLDSFPPGGFLGAADTIDITVTLLSSQRRPKLVARVWSVSKPLIPSKISGLYGYFFLASWSLTGPLIWPRTLYQALVLSQKHKLKIRDRPEPKLGTISRHSTPAERCIREIFIDYLRNILNQSPQDFYLNVSVPGAGTTTLSTPNAGWKSPRYDIFVLTPKFYATIVACPTIDTFLYNTLLHKADERRTACTGAEDPEALIELLKHAAHSLSQSSRVSNAVVSTTDCPASNGNTITQTWILYTPKLVVSSLLWMIWVFVTHVRSWLTKRSGEELRLSNLSSIQMSATESSTRNQVDERLRSHGDTCWDMKVTYDSECFLDHHVRENYGPAAQLAYLSAQLTTVVRERILSIIGGG